MSAKLPISAFIITLNEELRLADTLASLAPWVDELVVVDSGSTDRTPDIAKSFGANFIIREWDGYGPQKRAAEALCKHDWVLNVDADEMVSDELQAEITDLFEHGGEANADGFYVPIHERIYGTKTYTKRPAHRAIRLYRLSKGRYSESTVFDRVKMTAKARVYNLQGKILHHSIYSYSQRVQKTNEYTDQQVKELLADYRAKKSSGFNILFAFPVAFLKSYLLQGYMFYGLAGFNHSMNAAYARFLKHIKLYEAADKRGMTY